MSVYLDYNASAPIDERVLNRMIEVYTNHFGNADSRTHSYGTDANKIVEESRRAIANILNIDSSDLFFTSGSTESNNMAIVGLLDYAIQSGRNHFITTAIEHKSVLESMHYLERHGCTVDYVAPDSSGRIKPEQIIDLISEKTVLVSLMHVNSETGIIQPIEEVGKELARRGVLFHVDATQSFGKMNDVLRNSQYDMLSITAHKIGGPQGVGAFVLRRGKNYKRPPVAPLMFGGQQERGYRPGTTPVALVAGFAYAAQLCDEEEQENYQRCVKIKQQFIDSIASLNYQINGAPQYCIPSTINISFPGVDAEGIFLAMKNEYAFSNGSACNSNSHLPSYVLAAMGIPEQQINESVRISWNGNTQVDFKELVNYIKSMTE